MRHARLISVVTALILSLSSCDRPIFGGLTIVADRDALILEGTIDKRAPKRLASALAARPGTTTIVLYFVPGARDDRAGRRLAQIIHEGDLRTVVPPGGLVAAGGTDLFLAGTRRLIAPDACVGVHSWSGGLFGVEEGRYLPRDDPAHIRFRAYYKKMGMKDEFYWFSLESASVDGMHWMRGIEINHFGLSDRRVKQRATKSETDHRCRARMG